MDVATGPFGTHYVYRSLGTSSRRRQEPSLYLVERLEDSNVVARFQLLPETSALNVAGRSSFRAIGPWQLTSRGHHRRVRVTLATAVERLRDEASHRGMVVETGVDPVTSRFSGARSTN